jgi:hypothetical protein
MTDRLDELLAMMPADLYPEDLVDRVHTSLAQTRRRSRRIRGFLHFSNVVASITGLWLILPRAERLLTTVSDLSFGTAEEWLSALIRSPGEALLNLSGTAMMWISELASTLDTEIVFVLGILTASALYGVITLLSNGASQKEVMA